MVLIHPAGAFERKTDKADLWQKLMWKKGKKK